MQKVTKISDGSKRCYSCGNIIKKDRWIVIFTNRYGKQFYYHPDHTHQGLSRRVGGSAYSAA